MLTGDYRQWPTNLRYLFTHEITVPKEEKKNNQCCPPQRSLSMSIFPMWCEIYPRTLQAALQSAFVLCLYISNQRLSSSRVLVVARPFNVVWGNDFLLFYLTLVVRQRQQAPHSEDSSLSLLSMLAVVVAVHRVSPTITQACSQFNAREYYMAIRVGGCGYTVSVVDSSSPYYYYVQIYRHHITIHDNDPIIIRSSAAAGVCDGCCDEA